MCVCNNRAEIREIMEIIAAPFSIVTAEEKKQNRG